MKHEFRPSSNGENAQETRRFSVCAIKRDPAEWLAFPLKPDLDKSDQDLKDAIRKKIARNHNIKPGSYKVTIVKGASGKDDAIERSQFIDGFYYEDPHKLLERYKNGGGKGRSARPDAQPGRKSKDFRPLGKDPVSEGYRQAQDNDVLGRLYRNFDT